MRPPATVSPTATLADAFRLMHAPGLSGLYVVDEAGRPTGYVDGLELAAAVEAASPDGPPAYRRPGGALDRPRPVRRDLRGDRLGSGGPDGRRAVGRGRHRAGDRRPGVGVRRRRLERHLPAARDDDRDGRVSSGPALRAGLAVWTAKRANGEPLRPAGPAVPPSRPWPERLPGQRHDDRARRSGHAARARPLGLSPTPFLIAETLASNIGGAATLIGDPPNIIIGSRAGLTFNDFVVNLGPSWIAMVAFAAWCPACSFRSAFTYDAREGVGGDGPGRA